MKVLMSVLVAVLVIGLAGASEAAKGNKGAKGGKGNHADRPLKGVIQSVSADGASLTLTAGKKSSPMEVTVTTDVNTKVTLDGKEAKISDLKAGLYALVTPSTGTAKEIKASTEKPKKNAPANNANNNNNAADSGNGNDKPKDSK
jgi:hypothetical protein